MTNNSQVRGFIARVIRGEFHSPGDEGLSLTARTVLIVHPAGDTLSASLPTVQLRKRLSHFFVPTMPCPAGRVGYMAGGAYIEVEPQAAAALGISAAAYSLHDRTETLDQYAALSSD